MLLPALNEDLMLRDAAAIWLAPGNKQEGPRRQKKPKAMMTELKPCTSLDYPTTRLFV